MSAHTLVGAAGDDSWKNELLWQELYPILTPFARYLVGSRAVPAWRGQEQDVVDDIVQETMRRMLEYLQKSERGERAPVNSLKTMALTIARNYCTDLLRRDKRLTHVQDTFELMGEAGEDLFLTATENLYQEKLFMMMAREIAHFPKRQRTALLNDLANRMSFKDKLSLLQEAFLAEGVQLQEYQRPLPEEPLERRRQAALLSQAYKRLSNSTAVLNYVAEI